MYIKYLRFISIICFNRKVRISRDRIHSRLIAVVRNQTMRVNTVITFIRLILARIIRVVIKLYTVIRAERPLQP